MATIETLYGNGRQQPDLQRATNARRLDERRHPERQSVLSHHAAEVNRAHAPETPVAEHRGKRRVLDEMGAIPRQLVFEQDFFCLGSQVAERMPLSR